MKTTIQSIALAVLAATTSASAETPKVVPPKVTKLPKPVKPLVIDRVEFSGVGATKLTVAGKLVKATKGEVKAKLPDQKEATFTVAIEWACADESAGNTFEIKVGGKSLPGTVDGTGAGTWSRYRSIFVGEAKLAPGSHRLELRPAGPIRNALLDLRAVTLTPRLPLR